MYPAAYLERISPLLAAGSSGEDDPEVLELDGVSLDPYGEPVLVDPYDAGVLDRVRHYIHVDKTYAKQGLHAEFGYWEQRGMTTAWRKTLVEWMLQVHAPRARSWLPRPRERAQQSARGGSARCLSRPRSPSPRAPRPTPPRVRRSSRRTCR